MASLRNLTPSLALFAGVVLSARGVHAHGHDMSKIQDGEFVSPEPIVGGRWKRSSDRVDADENTGCDFMGSHSVADGGLWHYISGWNGSWGKAFPLLLELD